MARAVRRNDRALHVRTPADGPHDWLLTATQMALFAKIALILFVIDPQAADAFTLAKSAVSHVTAVVLAGGAVAISLRDRGRGIAWSPIHVGVFALLLSFGAASALALDPTVALFGAWRRYLGLTQFLDSMALYAATVVAIRTPQDIRRLFAVACTAAAVVAAYALVQRAGVDVLQFRQGAAVPVSTLGQPDVLGGFAGIVLVTTFAVLLFRWSELTPFGRLLLGLLSGASTGVLLSLSIRNAVLALGGGWLAMAAIGYLGPRRSRRIGLGIVAVLLAAALGIGLSPLGARFANLGSDLAVQSRLEIWETSLRLVARRPLLGLGPDNLVAGYPGARAERSELIAPDQLQSSTHNWLLYYATSAGLIGLASIAATLWLAGVGGLRLIRAGHIGALALVPLGAYLGQGLVDINDIGLDWILWLALGVIASSSGTAISRRHGTPNQSAAAAALALFLLVAVIVAGAERDRISASEAQAISDALVTFDRGLAAVEYSRQATLLDPGRAEYWSGLGTALGAAGNRSAATVAYLDAARREPWQPIYWKNAGLQQLAAGNVSVAIGYFEHATQLDAYSATSRDVLARLQFNRGEFARAADEGDRAVRLRPDDPSVYEAPVQAYIRLRQWPEAERLLRNALSRIQSAHLHVLLARVYLATGQNPLALEQVNAALVIEPDSGEAKQLRDQISTNH